MSRYMENESYNQPTAQRQRDFVLSSNEYCYLLSKTDGDIKVHTGPITMTVSPQESLVYFDTKSKRFIETTDFEKARRLFTSAPEGWYVVFKNPAENSADNIHPVPSKAIKSPVLKIGRKINVPGPVSFALYPGQMAKVVQGHRLRSNQYLLARVYDAAAASQSNATVIDTEGNEIAAQKESYFVGQLLVIKGTEISFYIPPTGIEVLPIEGKENQYVRDAVTLERLEYAILKDEDGEKRYIHGPAVVFPKPTETFVSSKSGVIFRALELSPISGIYIKVIADYVDNGVEHKTGEELFITGNEQMIYYPRPEHALIQYDGKYMHHAIAIPEGEGRYILNRLTGQIKTVKGPAMYLPDPRTEVVVKRKLSRTECELFYPGNKEVLFYNDQLTEKTMEKKARLGTVDGLNDAINMAYSTSNNTDSLAIFEANSNISRGVSYTKPRTITLDTKYEGVVAIEVWNGYAINVISKSGKNEIVVGPTTRLLNYDETLETITTPEGTSVFLPINETRIDRIFAAQTSDYVNVQLSLSFLISFNNKNKDKWFSINNYEDYLYNRISTVLSKEIRKYSIQEFYNKNVEIIRNLILNEKNISFNNGMKINDIEIGKLGVQRDVAEKMEQFNSETLSKSLELASTNAQMQTIIALAANDKKRLELDNENKMYQADLAHQRRVLEIAREEELNAKLSAESQAKAKAEADLQNLINSIEAQKRARKEEEQKLAIAHEKNMAEIEAEKQKIYADTVASIMSSIQPGFIEALNGQNRAEIMNGLGQALSPYSLAKGESVADSISTLLRGTPLESALKTITDKN